MRILVIDDNIRSRTDTQRVLEAGGFTVDVEINNDRCLDKISKKPYLLAVLSVHRFDMSSIATLDKASILQAGLDFIVMAEDLDRPTAQSICEMPNVFQLYPKPIHHNNLVDAIYFYYFEKIIKVSTQGESNSLHKTMIHS